MKQVAVIEFNGDWDKDTIQECLGLLSMFNYRYNQNVGVVTLTEKGAERVLKTINPGMKEVEE